jgi:hypothetical protein
MTNALNPNASQVASGSCTHQPVYLRIRCGSCTSGRSHYLSVFRFIGVTAFIGYGLALMQNSIWYKRNWMTTIKTMFDGLIYALFTAGIFGWLWPTM